MNRKIKFVQQAIDAQDGAGVKLKRLFPVESLDNIDPFLLMDHFGSDNPDDFTGGFPLHPHRGIETVTYMLEGRVKHRDSTGHSGSIEAGDVQWMTAGRGIMHEEMPQVADGKLDGFQLWMNLAAEDKMKPAAYQEYSADSITQFSHEGHTVRLISGDLFGHHGVVTGRDSPPIYADITINSGAINIPIPQDHAAFIYIYRGEPSVIDGSGNHEMVSQQDFAVLTKGSILSLHTDTNARVILLAGKPINEPIVRSGPFVMNTREEIQQTWQEIRDGVFPPV